MRGGEKGDCVLFGIRNDYGELGRWQGEETRSWRRGNRMRRNRAKKIGRVMLTTLKSSA